jgi:hypothetical protein
MSKITTFPHISDESMPLISSNIAWGLANSIAWKINMAARQQKQLDDAMIERPLNDNIMLEEAVRENLRVVVDIVDAALLDGVPEQEVHDEIEKAVAELSIPNQKRLGNIEKRNLRKPANEALALSMDALAYCELTGDALKDAITAEANRMRVALKMEEHAKATAAAEYADISAHMAYTLLTPNKGESIKGHGDFSEYLDIREQAFLVRLKTLRGAKTFLNGEWRQRYKNDSVTPNIQDALDMDSAFTVLLDEAIMVKVDVSTIDALPSQAVIDAKLAEANAA